MTKTLEQVEREIAETKAALENVHGTETEVYARIVGYYRAVKHWNNGKRDEFYQRKTFTLEDSKEYDITAKDSVKADIKKTSVTRPAAVQTSNTDTQLLTYKIYTRKTCPNCPPVKDYMADVEMPGQSINVDTKEGLADAAENGVFATPTVIFYNAAGTETARCHSVEELEAVLNKVAVTA